MHYKGGPNQATLKEVKQELLPLLPLLTFWRALHKANRGNRGKTNARRIYSMFYVHAYHGITNNSALPLTTFRITTQRQCPPRSGRQCSRKPISWRTASPYVSEMQVQRQ